jgi:hypothetical protein
MASIQLKTYIQAPPPSEERGLASSPYKYLAAAVVTGALAAGLFSVCLLAAAALAAISFWFLWSGSLILANRAADGTKFEKPIHFLHSIAMEFNAMVVASWLFPLTLFHRYHNAKGNLSGRPILLVNGYLSFGSTWHYLRGNLAKAGFGPLYTMNIGVGRSIATYAHFVQEKVKEIQKETGRRDIVLIGHSKGGLVSSYFASCLADKIQAEVTDIITIGSPWAGTYAAKFALGLDACEMRSESKFHQELRDQVGANQSIRYFHIASETDRVVLHPSSLIGKDPSRQLLVKDTGHLGLVFSSRVASQICTWLKDGGKGLS